MAYADLTVSEKIFLQQNIFQAIAQICSNSKRLDLKGIHSYLVKIEKLKELSIQYLQQIIFNFLNKKFKGADSTHPKLNLLLIHLKVPIPSFQ